MKARRGGRSEIGLVILFDRRVDAARVIFGTAHFGGQIFPERNLVRRRPCFVIPQLRTNKRLCAVEETFAHVHANRDLSRLAARRQRRQNRRIADQFRRSVDPQRFVRGRRDEQDSDPRIREDILEAEQQFVALPIRDEQR